MCIIIIIIIIVILLGLDFSVVYMFLAPIWKQLMKVELESAQLFNVIICLYNASTRFRFLVSPDEASCSLIGHNR
jgi:hypothetical protein